MCRVCKRWKALIKDQRLWRTVDISTWKRVRCSLLLYSVIHHLPSLAEDWQLWAAPSVADCGTHNLGWRDSVGFSFQQLSDSTTKTFWMITHTNQTNTDIKCTLVALVDGITNVQLYCEQNVQYISQYAIQLNGMQVNSKCSFLGWTTDCI